MIGKGRTVEGQTQKAGGLPIVTTPCDQTKILVIEHAISLPNPTKILARGAKPRGDSGLVYQRLPGYVSGSATVNG